MGACGSNEADPTKAVICAGCKTPLKTSQQSQCTTCPGPLVLCRSCLMAGTHHDRSHIMTGGASANVPCTMCKARSEYSSQMFCLQCANVSVCAGCLVSRSGNHEHPLRARGEYDHGDDTIHTRRLDRIASSVTKSNLTQQKYCLKKNMFRRIPWWRAGAPPPIAYVPLDVNLTRLNFLLSPGALSSGAKVAATVCERLYKLLDEPLTPQERHNVLDAMSNTLCLVLDPCEFVRHMHPEEIHRNGAQAAFSEAHTFMCELNTSTYLYDQLKLLAGPEGHGGLDEESKKNVAQLKRDMESNGIHLPDEKRKVIAEFNCEKEEIAGEFLMPVGQNNPIGTLRKLLKARQKLAEHLGFECFADQQLRGTILDSQERVWHFLCAVSHKYWAKAEEEMKFLRTMQGVARAQGPFTDEVRALTSHSYRSQAESLSLEKYFSVANCWRGIEILCKEAFGLELVKVAMDGAEQYHVNVEKFAVVHETEGFMGTIVVDLFSRNTKACQAGHMTVQLGCRPHVAIMQRVGITVPERQFPIVVLTCNAGSLRKPLVNSDGTANKATTLMHPHEVTTMFHEFGHAVHSIFGQTSVQNLAGTRSSIDFVETFSQFFELYLTSSSFVQRWAKDNDGVMIPTEVIEKYSEIRMRLRACDIMDQVVMSGIDQGLHGPQPIATYFPKPGSTTGELAKKVLGDFDSYGEGIFDLARLMVDISKPLSPVLPTERGVLRSLSMEHMASYPATYYGYLYSAVFARRIWDKFFINDPLSRVEGERLRNEVLRHGAACNPREVLQVYLRENLDDLEVWV